MKQIICYGDSNTWGLVPGTLDRYDWGTRWTSLLQEQMKEEDVQVIEEGLCGRTTVFEDVYRKNRNGLDSLSLILETHQPAHGVILMLGTNDCKSYYKTNAHRIGKGVEQCLDKLLTYFPSEKILLVSPIHLGEDVWKPSFDPEFDQNSVEVSKELKREYEAIAKRKKVHFLAASDYVGPSKEDQEHMDEKGHQILAEKLVEKVREII